MACSGSEGVDDEFEEDKAESAQVIKAQDWEHLERRAEASCLNDGSELFSGEQRERRREAKVANLEVEGEPLGLVERVQQEGRL